MNCQQVNKLLIRYDEGDLPQPLRREVEQHLQYCAECQLSLQLIRKERLCLQAVDDIPELSSDFPKQVMSKILPVPSEVPPEWPRLVQVWTIWLRYASVIGAVAVLVFFFMPSFSLPMHEKYVHGPVKQTAMVHPSPTGGLSRLSEVNPPVYRQGKTEAPSSPSRSLSSALVPSDSYNLEPTLEGKISQETLSQPLAKVAVKSDSTANSYPAIMPSYVPNGYTLCGVKTESGDHWVLTYETQNTESGGPEQLIVCISPVRPEEAKDKGACSRADVVRSLNNPLQNESLDYSPLSAGNSGTFLIEVEGLGYEVTVKPLLPENELKNFLSSFKPNQ